MSKELKITEEAVKEAAKNCPQAEATLKTLFPEVFKEDIIIPSVGMLGSGRFMFNRAGGNLFGKGFGLVSRYNWRIEEDNSGVTMLIPTRN